jgi:nucleotide-binding universal stress UspA family protein
VGLISKILFPVDFSPSSVAMAAYVKRAAGILNARVTLIHVYDSASHNGMELYLRPPSEIAEDHLVIARERLDGFLRKEFPGGEAERILADGDAATEITAAARKGFDLIVMPTHAGRFRRMLLGSTTAKVLDSADCPVMTSMHAEHIAPRPLDHREWLVTVGMGEDSERVLSFANWVTAEAGANLRIIHAIPTAESTLTARLDLEERVKAQERDDACARIMALQARVGSNAPVRIAVGPVKEALLEAANRSDADILVIGRSARPGTVGRLRDLTYAMVRDSPFPVVSV